MGVECDGRVGMYKQRELEGNFNRSSVVVRGVLNCQWQFTKISLIDIVKRNARLREKRTLLLEEF